MFPNGRGRYQRRFEGQVGSPFSVRRLPPRQTMLAVAW